MTRYNKTNVITMVKSLQTNEIPAFLEKISAHLEKMPQPELNEITATVIGCMMPPDKSCELSQFEEVMALTKKYFGARAFASLFSKWVQKNITDKDFMAFLEKHVKDITDIYSYPASLLNFLCETMNILFQKYRDFNTYELTHELRTYDDKDECEQSVHAAYASKNFRLFPSSQLIEICDKHGFMRTEKNNNIISAFKEKFDKAASAVAVQNFTVANKVIALFADEFAAISDPTVLNTYLASLVHHEGEVRGNLVNVDEQVKYSLVLPFVRAMRNAVKDGDAIAAVVQYVHPKSRMQFIAEQEDYLNKCALSESKPRNAVPKIKSKSCSSLFSIPADNKLHSQFEAHRCRRFGQTNF